MNLIAYKDETIGKTKEKRRKKHEAERKNQKREKWIMLGSSLFVLTALTMTGFYVNEKAKQSNDGYVVDLSQLEINDTKELVENTEQTKEQEDSQTVSSDKIENRDSLQENSYDLPWESNYSFIEEMPEETPIQEEVFNFFACFPP